MRKPPKRIEVAPRSRLSAVEHLAPRFFREVLGYEYAECLVTDESDLLDFAEIFGDREAELAAMLDRLEAHYFIDARDVGCTRIVEVLELLESRGVVS